MWGRVVEIATGVWLFFSPFIFAAQDSTAVLWVDTLTAFAIWIFAGLSYWPPTRHAHLVNLAIGAGLALYGRFANTPPTAIDENHLAVGLFLLMMAIIPNHASDPPRSWTEEMEIPASRDTA
jgi:hypothetical protein